MWAWVKVPKGIALAAFFLPWVTISCGNQKIASGTGWSFLTGRFQTGFAELQNVGSASMAMIIALMAIIIGLIHSFRKGRSAARGVVIAAGVAMVFIWLRTNDLSGRSIARAAAERSGRDNFDATMAAMINVEWQIGYYLTIAGLVVAGVMAGLVATDRDAAAVASLRQMTASEKDESV